VPWGFAAAAGASIIGSGLQANAAGNAQAISQNEFNTIENQQAPYMQAGYGATKQLNYLLGEGGANALPGGSSAGGYGSLNAPFTADTFKTLSPAYQFQSQQGAQGTLNQDSSAQGAESGAALKDLQSYNQNFANTSFNNAFNQYQTQQNNVFSRLSGLATLGENAAANTGAQGTALANQSSQSATNIGTALNNGIQGAGSNALSGALYGGQLNSPGGGVGDGTSMGSYSSALNPNSPAGNYWPGYGGSSGGGDVGGPG
jgi:hypothetical protein